MNLREYLQEIATTYDRNAPMNSPAQAMLRNASFHIGSYCPPGLKVFGKGGDGSATFTPWVGLFDPDETVNPHSGLYALYIYAAHLQTVTLAINHGVTHLNTELQNSNIKNKTKEKHRRLHQSAELIREELPSSILREWNTTASLACKGARQKDYEAGFVLTRTYDTNKLPSEETLRADLWELCSIYQKCILIRRDLAYRGSNPLTTKLDTAISPIEDHFRSLDDFRPKDSSEYLARIQGEEVVKQRRHESMLAEYVSHMRGSGFNAPGAIHPRDLVLQKNKSEWLVEAKVVYNRNAAAAARETIGQLFDYSHFLYDESTTPRLVGLFTEHIGDGYVGLLNSLNIATVWKSPRGWNGCDIANQDNLIPNV